MQYQNKIVLITGAGSGIGQRTAELYGAEGATVVVSDINEKGGNATVETITTAGGKAVFMPCNVAKYDEVKNLIANTVKEFGQLDIAVNNAGIGCQQLRTHEHTLEDWDRVIAVNQTGVFYCLKEELAHMHTQKSGCIINVSSIAGLRGLPANAAYVASKHAVVGMTKTAAMEYAKFGIRVNAICPVFTPTGLFQPELFPQEIMDLYKSKIPMKRFAEINDMAKTILYLSSEAANFVTGHAMPVDGGITA